MKSVTVLTRVAFSLTGLFFALSVAQAEPAAWVGGLFGLSIPNADNTSSRTAYGITGGAKLGTEWGVGGYYLNSTKDEDIAGGTQKFNYELYGIEAAYHFEGEAKGVYLGGRLGTSKVKQGNSFSTSPAHYGLVAGYNHMLNDQFSIGGDLSFLALPESSSSGVTVEAFSMLNFLASAKFWF